MMRYQALATDYDGTIAHDGVIDEPTVTALGQLKASGRKVILVTGRELDELITVCPQLSLFDRVVAENGALLYHPATRDTREIAPPPPPAFTDELRRRGVPISVGRTIVATWEPHEHTVLSVIKAQGLEWHVIFNKGSVMALPSGLNKATGLVPALEELGVSAAHTVAVGDAENDHAFFRMCGLSVAVGNALPAVKSAADLVLGAPRGAGVRQLIDWMMADDLAGVTPKADNHL